jgi:tRNA U34 5-methylaminomethyl-2-thiouridine-forming methyltransferase MnmC
MNREIVLTADGSHSILIPASGLTYHSMHGAISESMHVYIEAGLRSLTHVAEPIRVFEMGFGTGLNALLTCMEAEKTNRKIHYHTIEPAPLEQLLIEGINFCDQLNRLELQAVFEQLHACAWETDTLLTPWFTLYKMNADLIHYEMKDRVHIIYYDAFAPDAQPALWTDAIFKKLLQWLVPGGLLVTYSSKGQVRRAMQSAGFIVEKLPGAPPKREMTRAAKP